MKLPGICKNKECKKEHEFNPYGKASEIMFCSDACWKSTWITDVSGLVHPTRTDLFFNSIKNKLGNDIYEKAKTAISTRDSILNNDQLLSIN